MVAGDTPSTRRAHQPALDGLRGVAVAMVLLFHGGVSWMTGGYVGVSVFFTLSGFLITGLLLSEHHETGHVSLGRFFSRRARRLMPASLLCLTLIAVAAAVGAFDGLPHVRRDILASLLQVANWNALSNGTSYADLIARSSGQLGPVDHFWSLSIEEQFYWIWPLVCLGLFRLRRRVSPAVSVVGLAIIFVVAAPVVAHVWGPNAAYWATPARMGEILVGAALAALMSGRDWRGRYVPWLGLAGLVVIVLAGVTWPADGGPAYHGWLGAFALASVALIVGLQPQSPLQRAFSVRPLVHLGRISYGVYLFHWPVIAIMTERRTGVGGWGLFAIWVTVTLVIAELSFHLLEQPIRNRTAPVRVVATGMASAMAMVAVLVLIVVPVPDSVFSGSTDVPATFATTAPPTPQPTPPPTSAPSSSEGSSTTSVVATSTTVPAPAEPVQMLLLGDSTAMALGEGMQVWATARPAEVQLASLAAPGCGVVRGSVMFGDGGGVFRSRCDEVLDRDLPQLLATTVPDVVAVMVTVPDTVERLWSDAEGPLHPTDARYAARMLADYRALSDELLAAGVAHIAWIAPPFPAANWLGSTTGEVNVADWAVYEDTLRAVAAEHPDVSTVVRVDEWFAAHDTDNTIRTDGLHMSPAGALRVMDEFLGAELLRLARS